MRIKFVVPENFDDLLHRRTLDDDVAQGIAERKVEYRGQAGVDTIERLSAAFEECRDGGIAVAPFSGSVDLRIYVAEPLVPSAPERARGIGECVQTESIQLRTLGPPHRILRQVHGERWIVRIQVRQSACEPSVERIEIFARGGMRIH